jgi:hypothetical protein
MNGGKVSPDGEARSRIMEYGERNMQRTSGEGELKRETEMQPLAGQESAGNWTIYYIIK